MSNDPALWCEARCGYFMPGLTPDGRNRCHETAPGAFRPRNAAKAARDAGWAVVAGEWCCPACLVALAAPKPGDAKPSARAVARRAIAAQRVASGEAPEPTVEEIAARLTPGRKAVIRALADGPMISMDLFNAGVSCGSANGMRLYLDRPLTAYVGGAWQLTDLGRAVATALAARRAVAIAEAGDG